MPSVWPFVAETGATETLEYNTEVLKTYNKEQRLRLRDKPRYILNYNYFLDDEQLAHAKAIARAENQTGSFKVPVWQEAYKFSGTISSGATTITVDTWRHKFTNSELIVWSDWDNYSLCTIISKTPTQVVLSAPVGTNYTNPFVVPVKTMRALQGFQVTSGAPDNNYMSVRFTSIDHKNYVRENDDIFSQPDLFNFRDIFAFVYPLYKGNTVFTRPPFRLQDVSSTIIRPVELVDNGFGPIAVEATYSVAEERFVMDFFFQGRQQRWEELGMLAQFYGKQIPFWLPTFTKDILLRVGTFSSTTLTVAQVGGTDRYIGKSIYIKQKDGSYQFNTITNAVASGGNYTLTLETALSSPVSTTLTDSISYMRLSRFDTDTLEITTGAADSGKVTVNSIEVPN